MDSYKTHLAKLNALKIRIKKFLKDCNVDYNSETLMDLVNNLDKVIAVKEDKNYISLETNEKGYVTSFNKLDGIIDINKYGNLPDDLLKGYWKYEKGELKLDKKRKVEWR